MISRRDNLLIRPWQERKYENHRRKVQSALPAIDNRSPISRDHVGLKLKKLQKENERCKKIEKENLILLRRLSYIMRTNRVDNYWTTPQPNFLNRIKINDHELRQSKSLGSPETTQELATPKFRRKLTCIACTPQPLPEVQIPEERIPWEPPKKSMSKRGALVPSHRVSALPTILEKNAELKTDHDEPQQKPRSKSGYTIRKKHAEEKIFIKTFDVKEKIEKSAQSILISRGGLQLSVNFPSDTSVKFQKGRTEKVLMQTCMCKNHNQPIVCSN